MGLNSIGPYTFIRMTPPPLSPRYAGVVEAKAGVDDYAFWRMGQRGKPFQVETVVDTAHLLDALQIFHGYEQLIYDSPQDMFFGSQFYAYQVIVHDVEYMDEGAHTIAYGIGGTRVTPSYGMLKAKWVLIPTFRIVESS